MPCNSDHMQPTSREAYNQNVAILLRYVFQKLEIVIPTDIHRDANNLYCNRDHTEALCFTLNNLSEIQIERIVYNARDKQARKLADWWEDHQAIDELRIKQEQLQKDKEIAKAKEVLRKYGVE